MSVQKKEKAMWEMLDRFFLRVLGEKEGTAVMAESREQAASFLAGSQETSPSRRALMQSTILPRVAVYTVLLACVDCHAEARALAVSPFALV